MLQVEVMSHVKTTVDYSQEMNFKLQTWELWDTMKPLRRPAGAKEGPGDRKEM